MEDSKSSKKIDKAKNAFIDPLTGKKTKLFKKIKNVKEKNKNSLEDLAKMTINKEYLTVFNGNKFNGKLEGQKRVQASLEELVKARVTLEELYTGCNKGEQKRVNVLASKFLSKEEIETAEVMAQNFKCAKYEAKIVVLRDKLSILIKAIEEKKVTFNSVNADDIIKAIQKKLTEKMAIEEEDDEEQKEKKEELENLTNIINNPEEYEKIVNEKLERPKDEGLNKIELKEIKNKSNEEIMQPDDATELDRILEQIKSGEIKLDVMDNDKQMEKLANNAEDMDKATEASKKTLKNFEEYDTMDFGKLNSESAKEIIRTGKKFNMIKSIDSLAKVFQESKEEISNVYWMLMIAIKGLTENAGELAVALKNLVNSVEKKKEIDKDIQAKSLKGKNTTQIKKILKKTYIPEAQWKDLSSIKKSLHQIKDWDQYPRYNIWTKYTEEEKKTFFKERIMWNKERMDFLIKVAKGEVDEVFNNKYGWSISVDVGHALTNQLYYVDKYAFGTYCNEFKKLYVSVPKDVRNDFCKTRLLAKEIISKLAKEGKLTGFVYRKRIKIPLNNTPYWDIDLDEKANAELLKQKDKYMMNFGPRGPYPYKKPKIKKEVMSDEEKEDKDLLGRKRGF